MANILTLKRRIRAAQNVSKTTKAMQMIAASKLKRAQDATLSSRPYVQKLGDLTEGLTTRIEKDKLPTYMQQRTDTKKTLLIILSPDKGTCGALITNLLREFLKFKDQEDAYYVVVGKKAEAKVVTLAKEVIANFHFGLTLPTFDMVYPITRIIDDYYLSGKVDTVKVLYTHFDSIFTQKTRVETLLPIVLPEEKEVEQSNTEVLFEPDLTAMLPDLLRHYLEMSVYQFLLESFVSEQGARMIAMQNATNNANDIIEDLRLEYNKTRQAKITSEILDISSGAGASMNA